MLPVFLLLSCSSSEKLIQDPARTKIYFGHTGGFTNIEIKYLLLDNGTLFRITPEGPEKAGKLSRPVRETIRESLQTAGFESMNVNEPGNMTYFIRVEKPGSVHEVKWSETAGREGLKDLYDKLTDTLKR